MAGVLALAGFSTPKTLLPSSSANERGFWESEPVKALNDELFAELGTSWHGLDPISFESISKQKTPSGHLRAKAMLEAEFEPGSQPLIKDPRLCRLLPIWKPALAELTDRTVYAITVRSPLEVAPSLAKRNDFDADLSFLLWARHYLDAEIHTRGLPRVWITYDQLTADWRDSLHSLESRFGGFQLDSDVENEIDQFVSGQLRHHRTADEQAFIELERLPIVQQTYRTLLEATRVGDVAEVGLETLDMLRGKLDEQSITLSRVLENARLDRKRLVNARTQGEAVGAELAQARKALADLDALRSTLEKQSVAQLRLEERIDGAVSSLAEAIQQRSVLEEKLSEAESSAAKERAAAREERQRLEESAREQRDAAAIEIDRLQTDVERVTEERAALQKMLADAHDERESLEKKLTATARQRDAIGIEIDRLQADATRSAQELQEAIAQLRSAHELLETELKDVKRKYRSTQYQLTRDREKLRRTQDQLAYVERELASLRQSRVWRLYTALGGTYRRSTGIVARVLGGKDRKRKNEIATIVRNSPMFDRDWYLNRYPDVAAAGIDPAAHYLESGWREGRDPSPRFSTASYLRANGDVARAGLNPLLHYIEFGYSEGRHISELPQPPVPSLPVAEQELPPAAACASFPLAIQPTVRWRRAARLPELGKNLVEIAGQAIGLATDADHRSIIEAAFCRLATLSGILPARPTPTPGDSSTRLIDAWHVTAGRLRSRWRADAGPFVIRAYQHDPEREGALSLVGEALITSEIDFVDVNLTNRYFPALFVICDPDGLVRAVKLLAFPSLCRGGLHYPELVALQPDLTNTPLDVMGAGESLAERLSFALRVETGPFVGKILVDLAGADGCEPLFQSDFRAWLSKIMRVGLEPVEAEFKNASETYLREAVRLVGSGRRTGRIVTLAADTIPSIGLLSMPAGEPGSEDDARLILPVVIAEDDSAQPATLLKVPPISPECLIKGPKGPPAWPRLVPGESWPAEPLQVSAIRHPRRPTPSDSELLLPIAAGALDVGQKDRPITWLAFPEDWNQDALARSLEALAVQQSTKPLLLALVGDVDPAIASLAQQLFDSRVSVWPDVTAALGAVKTPLIGYLGAHVLLHDPRTCRVLTAFLKDTSVVSAACVVISTEKRGKGWQVSVADPGTFAGAHAGNEPDPRHRDETQLFWRATYPVLRPPRDLWIARSNIARRWLQRAGPMRPEEGQQICTSMVTASYIADRSSMPAHLQPPASAELQAIRSEVLVG